MFVTPAVTADDCCWKASRTSPYLCCWFLVSFDPGDDDDDAAVKWWAIFKVFLNPRPFGPTLTNWIVSFPATRAWCPFGERVRDEYGLIGRDRSTGRDATIAVLFFVSDVVVFSSWPSSWGEKATVLFMTIKSKNWALLLWEHRATIRYDGWWIDLVTVRCLMYIKHQVISKQ